jgi:hexosaminidase
MTLGIATPAIAAPPSGAAADLIPVPASVVLSQQPYMLTAGSAVVVESADPQAGRVGTFIAELLRRSTGYPVPVSGPGGAGDIRLAISSGGTLGQEGYQLSVGATGVRITANTPEGLFRGVTTLRQLLPAEVESPTVRPGPWPVAGAQITDRPRFAHRGTMLDVARHFFSVDEVKRYIDLAALYKINMLHLHLADDQGWRLVIDAWPRLATYGGSTEVGGGPGGYYTKEQFTELVRYAADRFITVIPEIDTPGHTNAALASYAELNCDGVAPPLYTGTAVGFSSLCIPLPLTYDFLDDVFGEIAALTPGPLLHLGGDEAHSTPHEQYLQFVPRAAGIVTGHGKRVMGWQEIAETRLPAGSLSQYWGTGDQRSAELARAAAAQQAKIVMSPADRAYLDMKYNAGTPYGLSWAGFVSVRRSYSWDPAQQVSRVGEASIAGVEAPLWSETLDEISKVEFMAFPRLPGIAEIGWSPATGRSWQEYQYRLGGQAPRWAVLGVNYYRAPEIPWKPAGSRQQQELAGGAAGLQVLVRDSGVGQRVAAADTDVETA